MFLLLLCSDHTGLFATSNQLWWPLVYIRLVSIYYCFHIFCYWISVCSSWGFVAPISLPLSYICSTVYVCWWSNLVRFIRCLLLLLLYSLMLWLHPIYCSC